MLSGSSSEAGLVASPALDSLKETRVLILRFLRKIQYVCGKHGHGYAPSNEAHARANNFD